LLASTGRTAPDLRSLLSDPPVRRGLAGREGRMEVVSPLLHEPVLVGYAPARRPRWAVIAAQPVTAALAPANGLLGQLSLLVLPILLLVLGAGGAIERLYRRQARLAQEN